MAALILGGVLLALAVWVIARQRARRGNLAALRRALAQIRLLRQLIEQVQRHRGLFYGVLSGEGALEGRRWSVNQQINQVLEGCRQHMASLHWYDSWHEALAYWNRIEQGEFHGSAEQMLQAHNEMIRLLLVTIQSLADRNDLVCLGRLAPQAEGLWLELLNNTETVGQSRAIGTGIVANRQNLPIWRAHLASLNAQINEQCYAALARLVSDPELRASVSQPVRVAEEALDALLERIRELLERPDNVSMQSVEYFQIATQALSAQLVLVDLLLDRLEQRSVNSC
ncbi:MAG: hypothetical protein VW877_13260 [Pseudomonadaceae bacterium]